MSEDAFRLPEDLSGLTDEELASLHERATNEFTTLYEGGANAESLARATDLADAIEAMSAEQTTRAQAAADAAEKFEAQRQRVEAARVPAQPEPDPEPDAVVDASEPDGPVVEATPEPELVTASADRPKSEPILKGKPSNLNASLATAAKHAPDPRVPDRTDGLVITASTPTAGLPIGTRIETLDRLVATVHNFAKGTPVTTGSPNFVPLATIQNSFDTVLSDRTSPAAVEAALKEMTKEDVLVAAGGWCAPSEIRYDFFNIACEDGIVDLPTIGIERGGIRWPVSPSLADVFSGAFTNATNPWVWTEGDDIAAVTGSPTKPCVRVPCPDFDEARLECYGICLTAGNLTDSAYPEATRNYLALLMAAHARAMNTRYLAQMVAQSTAVGTLGTAGEGTTAPLLGSIELAAIDYRTRYGMCQDAVLEVILPTWVRGMIRSDLAKRSGMAMFEVTDAMIADWFTVRNVRVQLVTDWQVRASGTPGFSSALTSWPTTVQFMLFAAGTFVRGNGMSLDLGVVRDSTLNSTNDHTAAWSEECHLIAKFGHESRLYTINVCADGTTGASDIVLCNP